MSLILNSGNETLIAPINAGWGFEIVWCHEQRGCGGEIFWDVGLQSSELVSELKKDIKERVLKYYIILKSFFMLLLKKEVLTEEKYLS